MQTYIIHYGELGLKGHNRIDFERRLVNNIRTVLTDLGDCTVRRLHSYLVVEAATDTPSEVLESRLRRIFGIAYFAPARVVPGEFETIAAAALELADGVIGPTTTFKVATNRGNKRFPMTSQEVSREIGAYIVERTHAPVRLVAPEVTLTIQIYPEATYLFIRRIPGAGGLPVGISGRVLTLLSGGIDSPVAAHMLLKRGCTSDFLHFHLLPTPEAIRAAKIVGMARAVLAPHRLAGTLFMVSAAPFESALATTNSRVITVVFRRFILRVAERLARRRKALALVTGDSVGQVASQTLQNIHLIEQATTWPILRPLIGWDKIEIINLAQAIDTYTLSIQPYQDPCSIHSHHPATWARQEEVSELEAQINVAALVEETLSGYVETLPLTW
ncbi:MAG TPA: tRNA uracil 4-sulfurtransferase ThiI [Anaerolineae bacterium]|nr:tRNA uracil 4-sulfurtransferase ThiI [Anaerolineae bacterium]